MKRKITVLLTAALVCGMLSACGGTEGESGLKPESSVSSESEEKSEAEGAASSESEAASEAESTEGSVSDSSMEESTEENLVTDENAPEIPGLTYENSMALEYASGFAVHYYNDGYALIDVTDSAQYLIVPEGSEAPEGLSEDIKVLQKPFDNIFMSTSSPMALFDALGCVDSIGYSATEEADWSIESAAGAMQNGDIKYAGAFNEPDYEMLTDGGCSLAIEDVMITYSPEVQEMLESLGIPVFIDMSSYEDHPLGRTEWIKAYSVLFDKEEEAESFFDEQAEKVSEAENYEKTDKTVAFFYIKSDGTAAVRNTTDYMVKMIDMAGGKYIYDEPPADASGSNITISMEEFYDVASDADYLIYNTSLGGEIESMDDLIALNELFADFKAVQDGNVYTTNKLLYQATDSLADFIGDVHQMITGGSDMRFLTKIG
jgi:iron complex transport system substrate-binding protein